MLYMHIQSNSFKFWYLTYSVENTGIRNEYQIILKIKKTHKKSNDIKYVWTY